MKAFVSTIDIRPQSTYNKMNPTTDTTIAESTHQKPSERDLNRLI